MNLIGYVRKIKVGPAIDCCFWCILDPAWQNIQFIDEENELTLNNTSVINQVTDTFRLSILDNTNIFHVNIRSAGKNFDSLCCFLENIKLKIDVIILTEAWISDKDERKKTFLIDQFTTFYSPAKINRNDGIVVLCKNHLDPSFEILNVTNCNSCLLYFSLNNVKYVTTCIYRSPAHDNDLGIFISSLETHLNRTRSRFPGTSNFFVIGDLNINLFSTDQHTLEYLNALTACGYQSLINCATRIDLISGTSTCIDHIFSTAPYHSSGTLLKCDISDHEATLLSVNVKTADKNKESFNIKIIDHEKLMRRFEEEEWLEVTREFDCNAAANKFTAILCDHLSECTTVKEFKIKGKKLKPWITNEILYKMNIRNNLARRLKNQPFNVYLKNQYRIMRNSLNTLIRYTKNEFCKTKADDLKDNPRQLWRFLNEVTDGKLNHKPIETILDASGIEISKHDNNNIADRFNSFFAGIGPEMASKINKPTNVIFPMSTNTAKLAYSVVTENDLIKLIKEFKNNSSPGHDDVSSAIYKKYVNHLIKPLLYIINKCYEQGIFPEICKKAVIIPIHKKSCRKNVTNYRPIALTTCLAKLIEKSFKNKIVPFLEETHFLSSYQFGFRKGRNTQDAILRVVNEIYTQLDKNSKILSIFIDLQKAFDSVSHTILLEKIFLAGICNTPIHKYYDFVKSYLDNRMQAVKVNGHVSDFIQLNEFGIPQGTVLGPIFFILYVNNMFRLPLDGMLTCFADDTALTICAESWNEVFHKAEQDINLLKKWMDFNLLTMNIEKTNYITFSITSVGQPQNLNIKLHSYSCLNLTCQCPILTRVEEINYLGVKIDQCLSWKAHTEITSKRLRRTIYKFRQLRNFLNMDTLRQIYYALVHSVFTYAIAAWGGSYDVNITPIIRSIQIIIRITLKKHSRYPSQLLYTEFKVPTFKQAHMQSLLYLTSTLATTPIQLPPLVGHIYSTRRRIDNYLSAVQINRSITYNSPVYNASKFFNLLPVEIKLLRNSTQFKGKVKEWIIRNA